SVWDLAPTARSVAAPLWAPPEQEVVDLFLGFRWSDMQAKHAAWACRRLVARGKEVSEESWAQPEFEEFVERARAKLAEDRPGPWETGSLLGAVSILEKRFQPIGDLLPLLIRALPEVVQEMSVKSLLRALSSLSHLQPRFPGVKTVVPSLIEQIVARIDAIGDLPRESPPLVRVIRHLGSLELSGPVAKSFLAEAVPRLRGEVLKGMDMRALASLARGLAQLGEQPTELFGEIADLLAKLDIAIHLPMILGAFARAAVYNDSLLETVATVWMKKGNLRKMKGWTLCMMMWAWPWQSEGETAKVVSNFRSRLQMRFKESSVTDEMVEFAWRGPEAFDEVYPKQPLPKKRRGRADAGAWEPARAGLPRRPSAPTRSWLTPPPPV
ncbi:unnamed protein product, partial [Prorocentrum cordatum]